MTSLVWTLTPIYLNAASSSISTSAATVSSTVQMQICNWTGSSITPNSNVYSFLNTRSCRHWYVLNTSSATYGGTIPQFRTEFVFQLYSPLNALDPSQILTVVYVPQTASPYYIANANYWIEVILSQGGQMLNSANYYLTSNATSTTSTPWYIPISNFFTLSTPGVWYKLTINGIYQDTST